MFRIQNVAREDIVAACQFPYKGYTISMSSIFMPKDICILHNGDFVVQRVSSVEKAIDIVNHFVATENRNKTVEEMLCYITQE